MLRRISLGLGTLLLCHAPLAAQGGERLFYYTDREDSYNSLVAHIARIDIVAPSAYNVDDDGIPYGDVDSRVLALARQHGVKVVPLLVNRGFDQAKLHTVLASDAARARMIAGMVELCRRHDYAGFQIDFENLSIDDRDAFTRFYREAANALHAAGKQISVAVVHRPDELAGVSAYHEWMMDSWRGGYDLKALADAGDFISIMTYSQHTRRTPPGPGAALPWVEQNVAYFLRFMPPAKLSLGISTGAMRWYTSYDERITPELARSYSEGLSYRWALGLIERNRAQLLWSDEHQASYAFYPVGGTFEWIFLEDARSFRSKLALIGRQQLRGFSVWVLGPEDPAIWEALPPRSRAP
jgi:spore germination protein YaaH